MYVTYIEQPNTYFTLESWEAFKIGQTKGDIKKRTIKVDEVRPTVPYCTQQSFTNLIETIGTAVPIEYTSFDIPKRNGKMRHIDAPSDNLKHAQKQIMWAMRRDLKALEPQTSYGFVQQRNCKKAMQLHQENQSEFFLKVDFKNMFGSITTDLIKSALRDNAATCWMSEGTLDWLTELLTYNGVLTQGSPSSPYIANLVLTEFDYLLSWYCRKHNLIYTRYADDLQISASYPFDWKGCMKYIRSIVPNGMNINDEKTQFKSIRGKNFMLGIMYNQDKQLTVGHEKKHLMKVICHKLEQGEQIEDLPTWKGRLAFYKSIEPEYFSQERFAILS